MQKKSLFKPSFNFYSSLPSLGELLAYLARCRVVSSVPRCQARQRKQDDLPADPCTCKCWTATTRRIFHLPFCFSLVVARLFVVGVKYQQVFLPELSNYRYDTVRANSFQVLNMRFICNYLEKLNTVAALSLRRVCLTS